jgi:hypothetical protein
MPVNSVHPSYQRWHSEWCKCRDAAEGQRAIRAGGTAYLPMLDAQNDQEYTNYRDRALFYGATDRTIKALAGAIMRKPPEITYPGYDENAVDSGDMNQQHLLTHIGAQGESIQVIINKTTDEVLTTGRHGLYVDSDYNEDANAEPYVVMYFAENVINWGEEEYGGRKVLQFVVLKEEVLENDADSVDPYARECVVQYRVLWLNDWDTESPWLEVIVYTEEERPPEKQGGPPTTELVEKSRVQPKFKGGIPVPYIPFKFINPEDNTTEIVKPPLSDLVDVNLSHYRNSADLEHGLHFTALPTAWVSGFEKDQSLRIGSSVAWISPNPEAKAGYIEFTGAGLGSIVTNMERKEQQMAVLGARLLEQQQRGDTEAAAAIRLRHSGEESVLLRITLSIATGVTEVLKWVAEWTRESADKINVKLNDQFNPLGLDSQSLIALMQMVQSAQFSWTSLYNLLQKNGAYREGWTMEEEKSAIESGGPTPPPGLLIQPTKPGNPNAAKKSQAKTQVQSDQLPRDAASA